MTRAPILFRVDAGCAGAGRVGWEHLSRCLIFAAALQRRRRTAYFLSQLDPALLVPIVKRGGNEWLDADAVAGSAEDLQETIQEIRRLEPAAVVVDAPEVKEDYLRALRATGATVVAFDSVAQASFPGDLLVNPLLGPTKDSYDIRRGAQVLLGARYAMVRPEVRRQRPVRAQEPAQPFRVLVALGDDDPNNQSGALARILLGCSKVGRVDIAVRPWHPDLEPLQALATANPDRLEVVSEPGEIQTRISRAHFAVTAGNAWALELACVGVPQFVIVQSEAHWPTAQRLEEEGAVTCLGWHENVSVQTIKQAVTGLLSDPLERQGMARCGRKLIDGRGPDRLVIALEIMLHPSRQLPAAVAA